MASTANTFDLLLDGAEVSALGAKKRNKKKKSKSAGVPSVPEEDDVPRNVPETAHSALDEEHKGFQTVVKGSRVRSLASAKPLDNYLSKDSTPLAKEARQTAEVQASSPDIQDTVESWTQRVQTEQAPLYLYSDGQALTWKEVLLSSQAPETLLNTCLLERVDASLEPMLATLFTSLACTESTEKSRLAETLAAAIIKLAPLIEQRSQQNVDAALGCLQQLFALLQAPDGLPTKTAPVGKPPADTSALEEQAASISRQLADAKPARQVELSGEILMLRELALDGQPAPANSPEPAAMASLRQFEQKLRQVQEDPEAQRRTAEARRSNLASRVRSLEDRIKEAESVLASLRAEFADAQQDLRQHELRQEQPAQQASFEAVKQQLDVIQKLKGCLDAEEPSVAPNGHASHPEAWAAYLDALLVYMGAQLRLQREVALKGVHTNERYQRKQQQVQQLAKLSPGKEYDTAAKQLATLKHELMRITEESLSITNTVESLSISTEEGQAPVPPELMEISDACRQQHIKILDGPLKLQSARLEVMATDMRTPLNGRSAPPSGPQQPSGAQSQSAESATSSAQSPQPAPTVPPPPLAYHRWTPAANPALPAWTRHLAPNFGELLQGSSVSQAPSKVPAPIAPASFHSSGDTPRGTVPALPYQQQPHVPPIGHLNLNGLPANGHHDSAQQLMPPSVLDETASSGNTGAMPGRADGSLSDRSHVRLRPDEAISV